MFPSVGLSAPVTRRESKRERSSPAVSNIVWMAGPPMFNRVMRASGGLQVPWNRVMHGAGNASLRQIPLELGARISLDDLAIIDVHAVRAHRRRAHGVV